MVRGKGGEENMNIKKIAAAGIAAAGILAYTMPVFAHSPSGFGVDTDAPNCHGQLVSLNARNVNDVHPGGPGLKNASEANHPNYGEPGPADSVQDFQEEIRDLCAAE